MENARRTNAADLRQLERAAISAAAEADRSKQSLTSELAKVERERAALLAPRRSENHPAGWAMIGCGPIAMKMTFASELSPNPTIHYYSKKDDPHDLVQHGQNYQDNQQKQDGSWDLEPHRGYWVYCNSETVFQLEPIVRR